MSVDERFSTLSTSAAVRSGIEGRRRPKSRREFSAAATLSTTVIFPSCSAASKALRAVSRQDSLEAGSVMARQFIICSMTAGRAAALPWFTSTDPRANALNVIVTNNIFVLISFDFDQCGVGGILD